MRKKYILLTLMSLLLLCGCENFSFGSGATNSSSNSVTSSNSSSSKPNDATNSNSSSKQDVSSSTSSSSNKDESTSSSTLIDNSSSLNEYKNIINSTWEVYGDGTNTISKTQIDENSFELYINNISPSEKYSTQCLNNNISVIAGSTYRLEITLKSSITRLINIIVQEGNYAYYDLNETVDLIANEEKKVSFEFVAQQTQDNMLFGIMTGKVGDGYEGEQTLLVESPKILAINEVEPAPDTGPGEADKGETPEKEGYNIFWSDEFNSDEINTNNWTFEIGRGSNGWGNNEYQYYTNRPENAYQEDGALHIVAKKESYNGANYTSARMITMGKVDVQYGYIEARIALPSMQGIWPAYWMLGSNFSEVGWPKCGEIDILEAINNEQNVVYSTLHWQYTPNSSQADHGNGGSTINDRTKYHLYGMNWTSEKIEMYVDNVKTFEMGINGGNGLEAFQKAHFFILNVAVGGNWPGFTIADDFPQTMLVDYIRVYQPK